MEKTHRKDTAVKDEPTKRRRDILCFAGCDWWVHNPPTEKHWMSRLAPMGHRVLFVNSIGLGFPSLHTPMLAARIRAKLRSLLRWLRHPQDNVWVLTPVVIPIWSSRVVERINTVLLSLQIRTILAFLGMRRPLFWAGLTTAARMLDKIPHRGTVYYIQDNYPAYYDDVHFSGRIGEDHARMLAAADRVICASIGMHETVSRGQDNAVYLPHGVVDEFFAVDLGGDHTPPPLMRSIPRPIVGYWGSLEVLQDQALIRLMAEAHPEWSIVFIGRPHYDTRAMRALPNVHFLGFVDLPAIPDHGIHFDVTMINWLPTEWVRYSCPAKLREYLALGKPVVSVDIIECRRAYPGHVRVADTREEFLRCVEEELAHDTAAKRAARRAAVAGETWDNATLKVARILDALDTGGD